MPLNNFRAVMYRKKYLSNDRFDNFYLTYKLRDVEERRLEMGKEGIFPLKSKEEWKYIKTSRVHYSNFPVPFDIIFQNRKFYLQTLSPSHTALYDLITAKARQNVIFREADNIKQIKQYN
jgi:hypothetical protein